MKLPKIISKNFKVLIRSRSSALVVILGPLLLILLVGLSFSNSTSFTLKIGVYSPEYNNLTESYVQKLSNENYRISRFSSEKDCVDSIKSSGVHICIIFPKDFEISNEKTNEIKFYIDQTKQNFVYAVVNTVTSSFSERSSELSLGLTTDIVDVVSRARGTSQKAQSEGLAEAYKATRDLTESSGRMQTKLSSNAVDTNVVVGSTDAMDAQSKVLRGKITDLYTKGTDLLNLSRVIYEDATGFGDENQTYENQLDAYDGTRGILWTSWNATIAAKDTFVNATDTLVSSVNTLLKSVEDSKAAQQEVVSELKNGLDQDLAGLQENLKSVNDSLSFIVKDINNLQVTSAENIVSPIVTDIETVVPEKSHLDYLFPNLIVLLIMLISILLSSTLIIMEKNSRAYFRNFTTPTNDMVFVLATFLTSVIIMFIQVIVILIIAGLVFKTQLSSNLFSIFLLVLLVSSLFVIIGMIIGYLFNTEQTGMIGAISVSSIILLTSDMILPIENMPIYIQKFAKYNPFVVGSEGLRKSIIFSADIPSLKTDLAVLGIMVAAIFLVMLFIQNMAKTNFFNKFALYRKKMIDRPENIREIFRIDNHLIKNQKELYRFVKGLSRKEFGNLVFKRTNRVADFAFEILDDKELAEKLSKMRTRWGVLAVIEKHTPKRTSVVAREEKLQKQEKSSEKDFGEDSGN